MPFRFLVTVSALFVVASAADTKVALCGKTDTIKGWPATPKNEPCYVHDPTACVGYPVCCVTLGTCVSKHGGMVSSNELYYENGCYSKDSSKKSFRPGCADRAGECNAGYLAKNKGGTTAAGQMTALTDAETARLAADLASAKPCVTWDVVTVTLTLSNPISDFVGYGSKINTVCGKIATAAGVSSTMVKCSAAAGSVVITAEITGFGTSGSKITESLSKALGATSATASAYLSDDKYTVTLTKGMTMVNTEYSSGGLSDGVIIAIAAGGAVGGILLLFLAYKMMKKGGSSAPAGKA